MIKSLYLLIILLLSSPAYSWKELGNGGDVIKCNDQYQLYDYYEAESLKNITLNYTNNGSYEEIIYKIITNVKAFDPIIGMKLSQYYTIFKRKSIFLKNVRFRDIKDSFHIAINKNCSIEQVAIQQKPVLKKDMRFFVNNDIWEKLDPTNKAGLVIHELLYSIFIDYGIKTDGSQRIRYLNALLISLELTKKEYIQVKTIYKLHAPYDLCTDMICTNYLEILGRYPDKAGYIYWKKQIKNGLSLLNFKNSLINSPEKALGRNSEEGYKRHIKFIEENNIKNPSHLCGIQANCN